MAVRQGDQYYMASVKLGPKGQIVIPKDVRDMFGVGSGDTLVLMADAKRGIALQPLNVVQPVVDKIFSSAPDEPEAELAGFASAIQKSLQEEEE